MRARGGGIQPGQRGPSLCRRRPTPSGRVSPFSEGTEVWLQFSELLTFPVLQGAMAGVPTRLEGLITPVKVGFQKNSHHPHKGSTGSPARTSCQVPSHWSGYTSCTHSYLPVCVYVGDKSQPSAQAVGTSDHAHSTGGTRTPVLRGLA